MVHEFRYQAPSTLETLLDVLHERGHEAKIIAGGADMLPNIRSGILKPKLLIDPKRIPGMDGISTNGRQGLSIGPAVTINALMENRFVQRNYRLLAACARTLASHQIRNRATVAGNVVNASPCSDMAPALLCLGARALVASVRGTREIPFGEFFTGVKRTSLAEDEFLLGVTVPPNFRNAQGGYLKLKRINGHDLGLVGVAMMKKDGILRFAVSSAAPVPVFAGEYEASAKTDEIVSGILDTVSPIDDIRCTKEYRLFMIGEFARRLISEAKR